MPPAHILVIDDDQAVRDVLQETLSAEGYTVSVAADATTGIQVVKEQPVQILVTDYQLPDFNGLEVIERVTRIDSKIIPIVMTGFGTVECAVQAMKAGAFDFVTKPFDPDTVVVVVQKAIEFQRLRQENHLLRKAVREQYRLEQLIGVSEPMQQVLDFVRKVADSDSTVLIQGESGTGKELIAKAIHEASPRADKPFVVVNCSNIPSELLESELFGHSKGAFTGAVAAKKGLFEVADGGTIFLDEIGDLRPEIQVRLLRVIQEREFISLGETASTKIDVRILAATNVDLKRMVKEGTFREDLFYRLNVVPVRLPPLRARRR